jgi:hypothetical protein
MQKIKNEAAVSLGRLSAISRAQKMKDPEYRKRISEQNRKNATKPRPRNAVNLTSTAKSN